VPADPSLVTAAVALALVGAVYADRPALGVGVFAVQLVFTAAWAALVLPAGRLAAMAIGGSAAAAADVAVGLSAARGLGAVAGVVAVAFLVALAAQLRRRNRAGVTDALASVLAVVALGVAGAGYLALPAGRRGEAMVVAALLGIAAALLVDYAVDLRGGGRSLVPGTRRGLAGAVAGIAAAVAAGAGYGAAVGATSALAAASVAAAGGALAVAGAIVGEVVGEVVGGAVGTGTPRTAVVALLPLLVAAAPAYAVARIALA
jgi:hypothetical protein